MPAQTLEDALHILRSAFPGINFMLKDGVISGGGITVAPGLIQGTPLQMVRIVGQQLKAIEDEARAKASQQE